MKQPIELDAIVAFTKCPCCQAEIEVRERWLWNEDSCWYVVVPDGAPNEAISEEEWKEQKKHDD